MLLPLLPNALMVLMSILAVRRIQKEAFPFLSINIFVTLMWKLAQIQAIQQKGPVKLSSDKHKILLFSFLEKICNVLILP